MGRGPSFLRTNGHVQLGSSASPHADFNRTQGRRSSTAKLAIGARDPGRQVDFMIETPGGTLGHDDGPLDTGALRAPEPQCTNPDFLHHSNQAAGAAPRLASSRAS